MLESTVSNICWTAVKHKKENPEANLKKTVHKTRAKKKLVVHKDAEPKAVEPKQSDQQYIFERFCQLYKHSRHARFS